MYPHVSPRYDEITPCLPISPQISPRYDEITTHELVPGDDWTAGGSDFTVPKMDK